MLYMPGFFGDSLMDDWMRDMNREFFGRKNSLCGRGARDLMKTDVLEQEDGYEVNVELPGFRKEDIKLSIEDGMLNVTAVRNLDSEEKDETSGRVIRRERFAGSLSRSFYVGEEMTEEDIKARLEDGILSIRVPKKETPKQLPEKKYIAIEG